MLTKSDILKARNTAVEKVEVPEWGGHVYVRVMSGADRDAWESALLKAREEKRILPKDNRAFWVATCTCDENGERLFDDADITQIAKLPWMVLDKVSTAAFKLNAMSASAIAELEKN